MIWLILLLLIAWWATLYLALDKTEEKQQKKFDYKRTVYAKEFNNFEIKHSEFKKIFEGASNYIVGLDNLLKAIIIWILSNWHILVEWMPWLAKTKTILVFSKLLDLDFKRIQFTPDMLPSDIIWWEIYDKKTWKFNVFFWPVFTNLLLADEINRATPKVQSALLEAMQERKVTIWWNTYELPNPFFVMATQNPIEQEWTFPLPEAQMDRFLMKIIVNYPEKENELKILNSYNKDIEKIAPLLSKDKLLEYQKEVNKVVVPDAIKEYVVDIINKLREKDENILFWPSPRWSISLLKVSQAIAYLQNKEVVEKNDVDAAVLPVLRHRVKLSMKAILDWKNQDSIICKLIK